MNHQTYTSAKSNLKQTAKELKLSFGNDRSAIRTGINDTCDMLIKDMHPSQVTDKAKQMYNNWLSNYACKLHPKRG